MNIKYFATEILSRKNSGEQRKLAAAGLKKDCKPKVSGMTTTKKRLKD